MKQTAEKQMIWGSAVSSERLFKVLSSDRHGFEAVSNFLRSAAGINMPPTPKNLILMASRLATLLQRRGYSSYSTFLEDVIQLGGDLELDLIQALTTNTTHFFREDKHFEIMKNVLLDLHNDMAAKANRELRVWCAAASTGQEPYSIAINICETLPDFSSWNFKFLATDIDLKVLQVAATGVYSIAELERMASPLQKKYFRRIATAQSDDQVVVADSLKKLVTFAQFNLMTDPYPFQHQFDIVFCRNVMIYFERETSAEVVKKIADVLKPGGYLFVGHSESGIPRPPSLENLAAGVWRKRVNP